MSGRIVVGVDGSPASVAALRWGARQARLTGDTLEAVTAWQYPVVPGGYAPMDDVDWPGTAREIVHGAVVTALGEDAGSVVERTVQGHPAKVLIEMAEGADLLVVGCRGHGGFAGMLLGSVSEHVIAHAPCPTIVIRHHDAEA